MTSQNQGLSPKNKEGREERAWEQGCEMADKKNKC